MANEATHETHAMSKQYAVRYLKNLIEGNTKCW
jgi:hypothetical protein